MPWSDQGVVYGQRNWTDPTSYAGRNWIDPGGRAIWFVADGDTPETSWWNPANPAFAIPPGDVPYVSDYSAPSTTIPEMGVVFPLAVADNPRTPTNPDPIFFEEPETVAAPYNGDAAPWIDTSIDPINQPGAENAGVSPLLLLGAAFLLSR